MTVGIVSRRESGVMLRPVINVHFLNLLLAGCKEIECHVSLGNVHLTQDVNKCSPKNLGTHRSATSQQWQLQQLQKC